MKNEMMDTVMKWLYTFLLLIGTIGWGAWLLQKGIQNISAIEGTGVGVLLGALLTNLSNVNQYWFRKKPEPPQK